MPTRATQRVFFFGGPVHEQAADLKDLPDSIDIRLSAKLRRAGVEPRIESIPPLDALR
jgi:hypothetical protein